MRFLSSEVLKDHKSNEKSAILPIDPTKIKLGASYHFNDRDNNKVAGVVEVSGSIKEILMNEKNGLDFDGKISLENKKFQRIYVLNNSKISRGRLQNQTVEEEEESSIGDALSNLKNSIHIQMNLIVNIDMYIYI